MILSIKKITAFITIIFLFFNFQILYGQDIDLSINSVNGTNGIPGKVDFISLTFFEN